MSTLDTNHDNDAPTRGELGKYVRDVYETEKEILTIKKSLEETARLQEKKRCELNDARNQAAYRYEQTQKAVEYQRATMENAQKRVDFPHAYSKLEAPKKKVIKENPRFVLMRILAIVASLLLLIMGTYWLIGISGVLAITIPDLISPWTYLLIIVAYIVVCIVLMPILILMGILMDKWRKGTYKRYRYPKKCREAELKYESDVRKYKADLEAAKRRFENEAEAIRGDVERCTALLENEKKHLDMAEYYVCEFNEHVEAYEKNVRNVIIPHLEKLEFLRDKLYSYGMIPPDYRNILCVIEFDQLFRNDLADDMRQAVLIYEERVFRRVVETNLDKIYNSLGSLDNKMGYVVSRLDAIREEVSAISSDMMESIALQEKTFEETRMNRYASEATARNSEVVADYVSTRRRYW